jgi:hypothetical protein
MKERSHFLTMLLAVGLGVCPILAQADLSETGYTIPCRSYVQKTAAPASNPSMTPAEQQFAMKLSALHRQIFSSVFTPDLRKEAMDAMSAPENDDEEEPMTPDMAVEQVISNHRDMAGGGMNQKSGSPSQSSSQSMPKSSTKQTKNTSSSNKKKSYWD